MNTAAALFRMLWYAVWIKNNLIKQEEKTYERKIRTDISSERQQHNCKNGNSGRGDYLYHDRLYPDPESAGSVRSLCDHGGCRNGRADRKRRIHRNLYRSVYRDRAVRPVCKGSICTGARNGAECIFCLYRCPWNGVYLRSGAGDRIPFRYLFYHYYCRRAQRGHHPFDPGLGKVGDHAGSRPVHHHHRAEKCRHCHFQFGNTRRHGGFFTVEIRRRRSDSARRRADSVDRPDHVLPDKAPDRQKAGCKSFDFYHCICLCNTICIYDSGINVINGI